MKTATDIPQEPAALTFTLLRLLADGAFHSGETLAQQLGISRASVSNALRGVERYGLELYGVRGRGYCLSHPPQWLDAERIAAHMGVRGKNFRIEVLDSAASSNALLLQRARLNVADAPGGSVLALEWQSGGRGRLGRTWHSGLGNALTFSLLWRFDCGLSALSGLSLAAGVALIRALRVLGIRGAQLKWPNDVLGEMKLAQRDRSPLARLREITSDLPARGLSRMASSSIREGERAAMGKLAGILIETQGDMLGPSAVVIGIGLNLSLQQQMLCRIGQPVTSLADMTDAVPERNQLLATILLELEGVLREFADRGFAALRAEWQRYHGLQDRAVQLSLPDGSRVDGIVRGVADDGALELETMREIRRFNAGEVSLRDARHAAA